MSDFIIVCSSLNIATNLGKEFIRKLQITGEFKLAMENGTVVHTKDGDRYYFTNIAGRNKLIRGRHDVTIYSELTFESALNNFQPENPEAEFSPEVSRNWHDIRIMKETRHIPIRN